MKIIISEEQANYLINKIQDSNDFYYPCNDMSLSKKLISNGLSDVVSCFSDDIQSVPLEKVVNEFNRLLTICRKKEENIKNNLIKIAYNTLVSIFNIPKDEIDFDVDIEEVSKNNHNFHISSDIIKSHEYNSVDDIDNENLEIEKRKILNMLIQGISMKVTDESRKTYLSDIFDLDEELPHLYSKLIKLNTYILYKAKIDITDGNPLQGGYVDVFLGNDQKRTLIKARGICFPVLLSEMIRGVLEIVISHALPDDINVAKMVINKSDILIQEPINMKIGLPLWNVITNGLDIETEEIPDIISELCTVPTKDFLKLIREAMYQTTVGKKTMNNLVNYVKYNKHNEFVDELNPDDSKEMIEDDINKK